MRTRGHSQIFIGSYQRSPPPRHRRSARQVPPGALAAAERSRAIRWRAIQEQNKINTNVRKTPRPRSGAVAPCQLNCRKTTRDRLGRHESKQRSGHILATAIAATKRRAVDPAASHKRVDQKLTTYHRCGARRQRPASSPAENHR